MSITHKLLISALTLSAAVGIGISAVQPTAHVSARRTYRVARYHTGYYRRGIWHTYKSGYYNRYWRWVPNHTKQAKRTWHRPRYHKAVRRAIRPRQRIRAKRHLKLYKFNVDDTPDHAYGYQNYKKALNRDINDAYNYDKTYDPDDPWFVNYVKIHSPKQTHYINKQSTNNSQSTKAFVNNNQPTQQPIPQSTDNNQNQNNNLDSTYNPSPEAGATVKQIAEQRTLQDINNDRTQNGLQPLINTPQVQQVAEMRANQIQKNYSHDDPTTGRPYANEDSQQLGYGNKNYPENINAVSTGTYKFYDGTYTKDVNNGEDIAEYNNQELMNHDEVANNGHRENILDPNITQVGIGVSSVRQPNYNNKPNFKYGIAEDFQ